MQHYTSVYSNELAMAARNAQGKLTKRIKATDAAERNLIVLVSPSLKQCWLTTRKSYFLRTPELIVERAQRRLAINKPNLAALASAPDLQALICKSVTKGEDAGAAKKVKHAEMLAAGYTMLSTCAADE